MAVEGNGKVYVSEGKGIRIQKFTSTGTFLLKWGSIGSGDGQFNFQSNGGGLAVDGSGNVFVADKGNNRIQKFSNGGTFLLKWGTQGYGDGQFQGLNGVAVDGSGNVYVADEGNERMQKFTGTGTFLTKWGGFGSGDGEFSHIWDVAVDASRNVFVSDISLHRIQKFKGASIPGLISDVQNLTQLNGGEQNSLIRSLNGASAAAERSNVTAACNELHAFENKVAALVQSGRLDSATGSALNNSAQTVEASLGCP